MYCPPARGIMAAISAAQIDPVMVNRPERAHAASSQPGAPTRRADSAEVRKIPEPIIAPMTIIVASRGPSSRNSPVVAAVGRGSRDSIVIEGDFAVGAFR